MAGALHAAGRFGEAERLYLAILAVTPDDATILRHLGLSLRSQGRAADAEHPLRRASEIAPSPLTLSPLGHLLHELGRHAEAADVFRRALALDRSDPMGVNMFLAAMGQVETPASAPAPLMRQLYGGVRSRPWDEDRNYRGADLVSEAVLAATVGPIDVLDLGCGTGRVGEFLKPICSVLTGVDLSADMIAIARAKGVYDTLAVGDLLDFLRRDTRPYDVITAAAVLVHFSHLTEPLTLIRRALSPDGAAVLTLFPHVDDAGFGVGEPSGEAQAGIFRHGRRYIAECAQAAGLAVGDMRPVIHEVRKSTPVEALLVTLRPQAARSAR